MKGYCFGQKPETTKNKGKKGKGTWGEKQSTICRGELQAWWFEGEEMITVHIQMNTESSLLTETVQSSDSDSALLVDVLQNNGSEASSYQCHAFPSE